MGVESEAASEIMVRDSGEGRRGSIDYRADYYTDVGFEIAARKMLLNRLRSCCSEDPGLKMLGDERRAGIQRHTDMHLYTRTPTFVSALVYLRSYILTYRHAHAHIRTYTHIYTLIHTFIHTCMYTRPRLQS